MLWIFLAMLEQSLAIYADETGISDFLVATTGHGPPVFVSSSGDSVVTSDSPIRGHQLTETAKDTSCFLASRQIATGDLEWRRNVCSNADQTHHTVEATDLGFVTMDSAGVIRGWSQNQGSLLWDSLLAPTTQPRIMVSSSMIAAVADDQMLLLDAATGDALGPPLSAEKILSEHLRGRGQARWLQMVPNESNSDKWRVLLGWVSSRDSVVTTSGSDLLLIDLIVQESGEAGITELHRLNHIQQIDVSSLHMFASGSAMALSADGKQAMSFGVAPGERNFEVVDISRQLGWSGLTSLAPMVGGTVAKIRGFDAQGGEQEALFGLPALEAIMPSAFPSMAHASCGSGSGAVAIQPVQSTVKLWHGGEGLAEVSMKPLSNVPTKALLFPTITVLSCSGTDMKALLTTTSGTTTTVEVNLSAGSVVGLWTAEEGLGQVSSALILDASHAIVVDDLVGDDSEPEPAQIAKRLDFSARLSSQWESTLAAGTRLMSSSSATKDRIFGFMQLAVLVSAKTHRLYGMELAGSNRGNAAWTVDLPSQASWHKLVHGSHNALKATHGIQGGTHAREILVISATDSESRLDWKCVDGTHGDVHSQGVVEISSTVLQIMPIVGSGACRQQAVIMHEDHSISVVPDADSPSTLAKVLNVSTNGLFTHVMKGATGGAARLESYKITSPGAHLVGQTSFPGERPVQAVYPTRDEVIQSPCTVLGDDSLLLKYLNPHLAVLITVRDEATEDPFDVALRSSQVQTEKKQKKKPVGVTPKTGKPEAAEADATVKADEPNLFVSVVDTVSGRVLYRASHANAATASTRHIQAVVSENWIIYSFVNAKTRKTEVGVLSLYEGMIHRKGLTAFTSPEQTTEFSSWDARETKPVVLAKTYSLPKPVTAIGVTQTKNGISAHQILLATSEDRIYAVGRNVLEPRRPLSDLKDTEKLEGLRQYSELIPLISLQALTYNLTVHAATHILSAPTELESQTLVFAYGGPDLFFTRTSPSKGFDMLPESFNRLLLSLLVVALVSVVFVTKKMATRKIVKHGWI